MGYFIHLFLYLSQSCFSSKKYARITENFNCLLICNYDWIIYYCFHILHRTPVIYLALWTGEQRSFNTWKYSYANFYMPLQSSSFHLKNKWLLLSSLIQLLFEVRRESAQYFVKKKSTIQGADIICLHVNIRRRLR